MNLFYSEKHRPLRRTIAAALSAVLVALSVSGCSDKALEPTEQSFSQIEYRRPDGEAVVELIEQAQQKAQEDFFPFGLISDLKKISREMQEFYSMHVIAQVRNYIDVTDEYYSEEMEYLNRWDTRIQNGYDRLIEQIDDSKFHSMMDRIFGKDEAEDLQMSAQASSQQILSLQEKEKELESRYYYEYAQATVQTPEGEVLFSSLEPQGQQAYSHQFVEKYNAILGELFLELVKLRAQMAEQMGYESYTQMADLQMLRGSYGREEIRSFREEIKQTLAPVYRDYLQDFYSRAENREEAGYVYLLGEPSPTPQSSWQDTLKNFETVYSQLSPQTGECYSYLLSHEYIDAAPSQVKANITFSTMLFAQNTPFLFANMDSTEGDVTGIAHEFGHCFAMWQQLKKGSYSEGRSMDVCEIHSQAMEITTLPYYEQFYGDSAGAAARYHVYTMVSGILTSAMNDEFQETVYQNPDMTLQQLNELYRDLALEYGLVVESPYFDMERFSKGWFTVNQYFDTPFYAIDYALSGCVALEFLQLIVQDSAAAFEQYLDLVNQSAANDFLTVVQQAGLKSPFEKQTLIELAEQFETFLQGDGRIEQTSAQKAA